MLEASCSLGFCKTLARIFATFSKISEFISLEIKKGLFFFTLFSHSHSSREDSISFSGVNVCKSAYFNLYFPKDSFESWNWKESSLEDSSAFCLRIPSKSLNSLFRVSLNHHHSSSGGNNEDSSSLSACKLVFDPEEVKFSISFWYAFGITKSTQVFYAEQQHSAYPLHPPLQEMSCNFSCNSKTLSAWFGCLGSSTGKCEELIFDFSNSTSVTLSAKAFGSTSEGNEREGDSNCCTKLVIKHEQFNSLQASKGGCWATGFAEFKAFATLACALDESGALSVFWDEDLECPIVCRAFGGGLIGIFAKNALHEGGIPSGNDLGKGAIISVIPTVSEPAGLSSESETEEFIPSTPPSSCKSKRKRA